MSLSHNLPRIKSERMQVWLNRVVFVTWFLSMLLSVANANTHNKQSSELLNWGVKSSNAEQAQKVFQKKQTVIVAVIDTGIDIHHPLLKGSLWVNEGETGRDKYGNDKSTNGIDDDGNGFVDDVHGWNFVSNTKNINDTHGHGTHVSGIIAAKNGIGLAPEVKIMVLKYHDPKILSVDGLTATVKSIRYALQMKAHVINYSAGGLIQSPEEKAVIQEAENRGIVFVAAAGNEGVNSDVMGYFPANYQLGNIISVTALKPDQSLVSISNYGKKSVHIAAPGEAIVSTLPEGRVGPMTGTSQATAFISAAAALMLMQSPYLTPQEIRSRLMLTGGLAENLKSKTNLGTSLDVYSSLVQKEKNESLVQGYRYSEPQSLEVFDSRVLLGEVPVTLISQ